MPLVDRVDHDAGDLKEESMKPQGEAVNSTSRNDEKKTRRAKKKRDRQNAKKQARKEW